MRITLDTNQLVRALMRPPQLATFVIAWQSKRFTVVVSEELLQEYNLVLSYPEVAERIFPELLRSFRTQLLMDTEIVALPEIAPVCRDPDDDKVIATAVYGQVNYLITADEDLHAAEIVQILAEAGTEVISYQEFITRMDEDLHFYKP